MSDEAIGARRGDYEILGVLGTGGMGKVYKVRNIHSDRIEAMKVLLPNAEGQKDLAARFSQEIKVLAGLNHPNIAALRTALTIDNQLVMIMEYVNGTTLAARVEQGAIPCADALRYIDQVLAALSYAHERNVFHRDIKPANMMLTPDGVVKVMDFGIARSGNDPGLTVTGTTVGSLAYMSPEQVKCERVDARSDLYSVGISLYEMVTGKRPFSSDSSFAIMEAHVKDRPKPPIELQPGFPPAVSSIILMALEKEPANRFQSADAFRNAIRGAAADLGMDISTGQPFMATAAIPAPAPTPGAGATRANAPAAAMAAAAAGPGVPSGLPVQAGQGAPMPPSPANSGSHRGLYITLGALIVAAVLVAGGFLLPRVMHTGASDKAAPAVSQPANNPPVAATPAPATAPAPDVTPNQPPAPAHAKKGQGQQAAAENVPPVPAGPDPAQVAALEHEADQLSARQAAVNASLDNLQQQMSAQGLGLRGDMVAARSQMDTYLSKAQQAMAAQDLDAAKRYLDLAQPQVEKLEKFLGR
jgi:serine/threonine-protein kinase